MPNLTQGEMTELQHDVLLLNAEAREAERAAR